MCPDPTGYLTQDARGWPAGSVLPSDSTQQRDRNARSEPLRPWLCSGPFLSLCGRCAARSGGPPPWSRARAASGGRRVSLLHHRGDAWGAAAGDCRSTGDRRRLGDPGGRPDPARGGQPQRRRGPGVRPASADASSLLEVRVLSPEPGSRAGDVRHPLEELAAGARRSRAADDRGGFLRPPGRRGQQAARCGAL